MQVPEFSNNYEYHDLCFTVESVDDMADDMIDCCIVDTSFETANNFDFNFEILEEEFQAMTSRLQTNLSILSSATATAADASKSSLTMNKENMTSNSNNTIAIANALSAMSPDINNKEKTTTSSSNNNNNNINNKTLLAISGKQLTQCQVVLQELRTECKNKGNAADDGNSEAEFMGLVQRLSLYKIQLEMLRSEHEMHQHQQHQQQQQQQQQQQ
jgi:hypothetical protein